MSGPGLGGARCPSVSASRASGPFGMQRSLRGARVAPVTDRRRLIVMRHAKAEPFAASDHERALTDRGLRRRAPRPARWLARARASRPTTPWSRPRVRTRQTWEALVEAAGLADCEVSFDDAVFTGRPRRRRSRCCARRPTDADALVVRRPQPDRGLPGPLLDDGERRRRRRPRDGRRASRPARSPCSTCDGAVGRPRRRRPARVVDFHVGRG